MEFHFKTKWIGDFRRSAIRDLERVDWPSMLCPWSFQTLQQSCLFFSYIYLYILYISTLWSQWLSFCSVAHSLFVLRANSPISNHRVFQHSIDMSVLSWPIFFYILLTVRRARWLKRVTMNRGWGRERNSVSLWCKFHVPTRLFPCSKCVRKNLHTL